MTYKIYRLYRRIGLFPFLYTIIKWRLTPFCEMEKRIPKKGRVFDLGCGNGLFSNYIALKSTDRNVIGIDASDYRIKVAKATIKDRNNINFYLKKIEDVDLTFCDCIVLSDFLHHLPFKTQKDLIQRCYNALNKDGILIIKEISKHPRWKFIFSSAVDSILNFGHRLSHTSACEFVKLLEKHGFKVETLTPHGIFFPFTNIIYTASKTK